MLSTTQKGDSAALLAAHKIIESGLTLLKPLSEALPYDFVIEHNKKFYKLQVKRAQPRIGKNIKSWYVPFRQIKVKVGGVQPYRYSTEDTDYIVGVIVETGDLYFLSLRELENVKSGVPVNPANNYPHNVKVLDVEKYRNKLYLDNIQIGV